MKTVIVAATAALLVLSACNGADDGAAGGAAANQTNAAEAAPAANAAAGGKDPAVAGPAAAPAESGAGGSSAAASSTSGPTPPGEIRALLVGRWTDSGDCARATEFRANGTFASPGGEGRWTLSEMGYLDLTGAGPAVETSVQRIDRQAMTTFALEGGVTEWTRC